MDSKLSKNITTMKVVPGFLKFIKTTAAAEEISMLELQRRIAKANGINLKEPRYKKNNVPGRFKIDL